MADINPFAQEPVCRYSEVMTTADLEAFVEAFEQAEQGWMAKGDLARATYSCLSHLLCAELIAWIKAGKPEDFDFHPEQGNEDEQA